MFRHLCHLATQTCMSLFTPVLLVLLVSDSRSIAQCSFDWLPGAGFPGANGAVHALTLWDPDDAGPQPEMLIAGGQFTIAGDVFANRIAAWNGEVWQSLGNGIGGGETPAIIALTVYKGEVIAGGRFTTAGGASANHIARWDGTTWQPLGAGLSGGYPPVVALTVFNGELVAAGSFTGAGGISVNNIARWDGSDWQPLDTGLSGGFWSPVTALAVFDGELIAGGTFTSAGGVELNHIARWNGTSWQALGSGIDQIVNALAVYDGQLFAGGDLRYWNGTSWELLDTGMVSTEVNDLQVWNGQLYANGYFVDSEYNSSRLARWDGSKLHLLDLPFRDDSSVDALCVFDSELFIAGIFHAAADTVATNIARWNGDAWNALGEGIGSLFEDYDPYIDAMATYRGDLIAGGRFATAGAVPAKCIGLWNGHSWQSLGTGIEAQNEYTSVRALVEYDGDLIAAGYFYSAGGVASNNIARWNGASWQPLGEGLTGSLSGVEALAVFNGQLIAAGDFTAAGGISANNIAGWNGSEWHALGAGMDSDPPFASIVHALTTYDGELIAGGQFSRAGGKPANGIARWNGDTWLPLGINEGTQLTIVWALTVFDGDLIVGGGFSSIDGVSANRIARWDGANWSSLGTGMSNDVLALTTFQGDLIATGSFDFAGGIAAPKIARWDGTSWQAMGAGLTRVESNYFDEHALVERNGELFVGGSANVAGIHVSAYVARWGPTCPIADLNCDQSVDADDIAPFVSGLLDPSGLDACLSIVADINHDGLLDGRDVHLFTLVLLAGGCTSSDARIQTKRE